MSDLTTPKALRLSAWLGISSEVWLGMQTQWDLWQVEHQPGPEIEPMVTPLIKLVHSDD